MAELVVPNGGQISLKWNLSGQAAYNVLGLNVGAGALIDQNMANAVSSVVATAFAAAGYPSLLDQASSLDTIALRDLRGPNLPEFVGTSPGGIGSSIGEQVGNDRACLVTLRTAYAGKSYRGRVYLPMNASSALDTETSSYTSGATTAAKNFIDQIISGLAGNATIAGTLRLAVVSRKPGEERSSVVIRTEVRSPLVTSQRRRLPTRG